MSVFKRNANSLFRILFGITLFLLRLSPSAPLYAEDHSFTPMSGTHLLPRQFPATTKRQPSPSFSVGDTLTVPAFSFQIVGGGLYHTTTTCRVVGSQCYVFVEDEIWGSPRVTQTDLQALAESFDSKTAARSDQGIFTTLTDLFGPSPDVDNDPRILIVVLDILDSGSITGTSFVGYFDTDNQAPPTSREIIYIDTNPLDLAGRLARGTLAHEFQHMIHWGADPDEDKWVDEGCSEYAELACGYKDTTQSGTRDFLTLATNTSLTEWEDLPFDFDQAYLWMTYFVQRFGQSTLRNLVGETGNGIAGINTTFESLQISNRFESTFSEWSAALFLDGPENLGYERLSLAPANRESITIPAQLVSRQTTLWGVDYLDIFNTGPGVSLDIGSTGLSGLLVTLITRRDSGPASAGVSVAPGTRARINTFGPDTLTLAISRTSGTAETYSFSIISLDGTSPAASDFNGNGEVGFEDFLSFAGNFGPSTGEEGFNPTFDLDGDRQINFSDFIIFAGNFGADF